jgi:hypothetical protein
VINTRDGTDLVQEDDKEELYIGTVSSEHIEMYLKAIWFIREKGEEVKVSSIARVKYSLLYIYKAERIVDISSTMNCLLGSR